MADAKLVSVNTGKPREVEWRGQKVSTGIYKSPVDGPVPVRFLNLEGDGQADLRVHGGRAKAVYAYPSEHYGFWRIKRPDADLPHGAFGENLTTSGLLEDSVHVGDHYRIGSAEFVVTQPRMPCFKLGIKFGTEAIIKEFLESRRSGFYFSVRKEGVIEAGQAIECVHRDPRKVAITDIARLYLGEKNPELLKRALQVEALPENWKNHLLEG